VPLAALALAIVTPWKEPLVDTGLLRRAAHAPRLVCVGSRSSAGLPIRLRPADAWAWVVQGGFSNRSPGGCRGQPRGLRLDPRHEALRAAAVRAGVSHSHQRGAVTVAQDRYQRRDPWCKMRKKEDLSPVTVGGAGVALQE
jgi:hypothetical protein